VLDELRRLDPLSRRARAQVSLVHRARAALERHLGRAPTEAEVAEATGCSFAVLRQIAQLAAAAETCSLQMADHDGEAFDTLVDADAVCPAATAEIGEMSACVQAALSRLSANHAHVLRRYHLDEATLDEIAAELGISKERVRQIRESAEKRLRADFVVLALWQSVFARERDG
jgi:RNA polymerase sigma factor FliA